MSDDHRAMTIYGGTFTGSTVANGNVHQTIINHSQGAQLLQLRNELRAHRDELVAAGGPRVADRLDEIDAELASGEPDPEIVRGGWRSIGKLLTGAGTAAENLKKITELIQQIFAA